MFTFRPTLYLFLSLSLPLSLLLFIPSLFFFFLSYSSLLPLSRPLLFHPSLFFLSLSLPLTLSFSLSPSLCSFLLFFSSSLFPPPPPSLPLSLPLWLASDRPAADRRVHKFTGQCWTFLFGRTSPKGGGRTRVRGQITLLKKNIALNNKFEPTPNLHCSPLERRKDYKATWEKKKRISGCLYSYYKLSQDPGKCFPSLFGLLAPSHPITQN